MLRKLRRKRKQKLKKRRTKLFRRQKTLLIMQLIRQRKPSIEEELTPTKQNKTVRRRLQSFIRSLFL